MFDLLYVKQGSVHCVLTRQDRLDQFLDLDEELVIAHDCNDLLIVGLFHAAVILCDIGRSLPHKLVRC